MTIEIRRADSQFDRALCVQIRTVVFVTGQQVPFEQEVDRYEDEAIAYLALIDQQPVGTVRFRLPQPDVAKIERLAVREEYQGRGVGRALMQHVLKEIGKNSAISLVKLSAQDAAIGLYEKFGFCVVGDGYLDGGTIPHHDMVLRVSS